MARAIRAQIFTFLDCLVPKSKSIWVFPVYFLGEGAFCDNTLAVFRAIDPGIDVRVFILSRAAEVHEKGRRCKVVPMSSYRAVWILMRCGVIFVQHSLWLDLSEAKFLVRKLNNRVIANLWHGIAFKDISHKNTGIHMNKGTYEMPHYVMPCSSRIDKAAMARGFPETPAENIWVTGIPRNDFLICEESLLPPTYREQLLSLRKRLGGRRLVLYAPTYRETPSGGEYLELNQDQLGRLARLLRSNNAVLGVRFHSYRPPQNQAGLMLLEETLDVSAALVDDVRVLVRESCAVITDYSSIALDALYANKPMICFAYDLDHYATEQRGFFYDIHDVFGDQVARDFNELESLVNHILQGTGNYEGSKSERQEAFGSKIFEFTDGGNASRFVNRMLDHLALVGKK